MASKRLKHRELLKKLKHFNVMEDLSRGRGSERMLVQNDGQGGKYKGPFTTIKFHGDNTEYSNTIIKSILRTFSIDEKEFWDS